MENCSINPAQKEMGRVTLFNGDSTSNISPIFYIRGQVTVQAVNMLGGDVITFEQVHMDIDFDPGKVCGCFITEPSISSHVIGTSQLNCQDCVPNTPTISDGSIIPVRITTKNPTIILDFPQDSFVQAVYHGEGLGTANVWAYGAKFTQDTTDPVRRGCQPICMDYIPTLNLGCGAAYRPTDIRDPKANVEVKDCVTDETLMYLYPKSYPWAAIPITDCETDEIIGFAVNKQYIECAENTCDTTLFNLQDSSTVKFRVKGNTISADVVDRVDDSIPVDNGDENAIPEE